MEVSINRCRLEWIDKIPSFLIPHVGRRILHGTSSRVGWHVMQGVIVMDVLVVIRCQSFNSKHQVLFDKYDHPASWMGFFP